MIPVESYIFGNPVHAHELAGSFSLAGSNRNVIAATCMNTKNPAVPSRIYSMISANGVIDLRCGAGKGEAWLTIKRSSEYVRRLL